VAVDWVGEAGIIPDLLPLIGSEDFAFFLEMGKGSDRLPGNGTGQGAGEGDTSSGSACWRWPPRCASSRTTLPSDGGPARPGSAPPCNPRHRHHVLCMAHTHSPEAAPFTGAFRTAITLAELLQRVDAAPASIGAGQYRALVQHLGVVLDELPSGVGLQKLLDTFPAAAMVYENRHYCHAGLCRATLEQSLNSELAARRLIEKVQATRA
jgi:hypothetical protein